MKALDNEAWNTESQKKTESGVFGHFIVDLAKTWATMMEERMVSGKRLGAIVLTSLRKVNDIDAISDRVFAETIQLLVKHWEYGDQLYKWYKLYCKYNYNKTIVSLICWMRGI